MADRVGKIGKIIGVIIVASALFLTVKDDFARHNRLLKNKKFTIGYVYGRVPNGKNSGNSFAFSFYYKGRNIQHFSTSYVFVRYLNWSNYVSKRFYPVIFDSEDVYNSDVLMSRQKFTQYKIQFPDSLIWTEQYLQ